VTVTVTVLVVLLAAGCGYGDPGPWIAQLEAQHPTISNLDNLETATRVSYRRSDPRGENLLANTGGAGAHRQQFVPRDGYTTDDIVAEIATTAIDAEWTPVENDNRDFCATHDGTAMDGTDQEHSILVNITSYEGEPDSSVVVCLYRLNNCD
jgi:hypothetical protein